jgi:hypothetical protein
VAGYLNIPMVPPPHTWAIILLVYLIGLLSVAKALAKNEVNYTSKIIFFSCILGLGLFAYYEGQSSDITLFRTSYPAIVDGYLGQKVALDSPLVNALNSNPKQASENLVSYKDIEYVLQTPKLLSNAEVQQMYASISDVSKVHEYIAEYNSKHDLALKKSPSLEAQISA